MRGEFRDYANTALQRPARNYAMRLLLRRDAQTRKHRRSCFELLCIGRMLLDGLFRLGKVVLVLNGQQR
jgi:hypothetical protein